jgi:acetylornithine deacetylase
MRDKVKEAIETAWPDQLAFLKELTRLPSVTGQERAVQQVVEQKMRAIELAVDAWCPVLDDVAHHPAFSDDGLPLGVRPVVVGRWAGNGSGRSMILNGHVDVVPAGDETLWAYPPWAAEVADDRLHGRGSCDMKAGLAAALFAVDALKRAGFAPSGDVIVESVIGEETGGVGTLATLTRGYRADAAIVMEPTGLALAPAGCGALSFRLTVPGKAAHGGLREEGVSALSCFLPLHEALGALETRRHQRFSHPLYNPGRLAAPLSIGVVRCGEWVSTVPEFLVAEGRYGVFPGESIQNARAELEKALSDAARTHPFLSQRPPTVEWFEGQFEPGETPADAPIIETIKTAHRTITGHDPQITGVPWGSDLRFFTNHANMPAVLYGAGDVRLAHTVRESVPLDEVKTLTVVLATTILEWCG